MNTALERLFTSLAEEADIDRLVRDRREEDLYLEFKQKEDRRTGDLDRGDKTAFSKAIAGFANADGGVLIFGVATTRTADGVDRAASLKPISNHLRFRSKLLDSILNTTQPVVDDVRIESIESANGGGYVKCLIPQSVKPPHRAMLAESHYWRRIGTGHRKMEHYELEDVFGRRLRPSLRLLLELRPRPNPDELDELHFFFRNEGRGLARHTGMLCRPSEATILGTQGKGLQDVTADNFVSSVSYYDAHSVIHSNGIYAAVGHAIVKRNSRNTPLSVEVVWYAENMDTRRAATELASGSLVELP